MQVKFTDNRIKGKVCSFNGITFDSKTEMDYYLYLLSQKQSGEITAIELQPKYVLQQKCERFGKKYMPITYTPDFLVTYSDGRTVAIDVKGYSMEDAALKRKLFAYQHPELELRWIAKSNKYSNTGWIDYDELMKRRRAAKRNKE